MFLNFNVTRKHHERWRCLLRDLHEVMAQEYYLAETTMDIVEGAHSVTLARAALGPIRVMKLSLPGTSTTIRTTAHIRRNDEQLHLIWFITEGGLTVEQANLSVNICEGQYTITSSDRPFRIKTLPNSGNLHESYQVVVPSHLMVELWPEVDSHHGKIGSHLSGAARTAYDIFSSLFENSESLPLDASIQLAMHALRAIVLPAERGEPFSRRVSSQQRCMDIQTYIARHLGDSELDASKVAEALGISVRYLHRLCSGGPSFSEMLWGNRLERAHVLLTRTGTTHLQIAQIARTVGFSSPVHFSRAYRRRFGCSPRQSRNASLAESQ